MEDICSLTFDNAKHLEGLNACLILLYISVLGKETTAQGWGLISESVHKHIDL